VAVTYDLTGTTQIFDDGSKLTTYLDGTLLSRDTGGGIAVTKPDGTLVAKAVTNFSPTNLTLGSVTTAATAAVSGVVDSATVSAVGVGSSPNGLRGLGSVESNPLEKFATYNTLFTLAALSADEVNNPFLYRNTGFSEGQVVISSAGRYDELRARTSSGTPEYFINNFQMTQVLTGSPDTGSSTGVNMSFDVYEPYSMGLFLQSLQYASIQAGVTNYLDAPFCIKIEFVGFDDQGNSYIDVSPKFYTVQLKRSTFSVSEGGSTYKFEAIPMNHAAFSDIANKVYSDVSLVGDTVKEALVEGERSLVSVLNAFQIKTAGEIPGALPDKYEIHFPNTSADPIPGVDDEVDGGAVVSIGSAGSVAAKSAKNILTQESFTENTIGNASFNFQIDSAGNYVAPKASQVYDEISGKVDLSKMTVDAKKRTFQYSQNTSITQIITNIIIESDYGKKNLKSENWDNGFIKWFRIDMQVQFLGNDTARNKKAKKLIIRIMPYRVHSSVFANPTSAPVGYPELTDKIVKQYDYIYTGQNNDLIKFDIQINNAFYTAIAPTSDGTGGRTTNRDINSAGNEDIEKSTIETGTAGPETQFSPTGTPSAKPDPAASKKLMGGSGNITTATDIATQFHKAFVDNTVDLISINFDILGDSYWLSDSGVGGYIADADPTSLSTADGAVNYEAGDSFVYLRFRSPIEPKEDNGDYLFVDKADSPFSGIYKVIKVEHIVNDGVFKQSLKAIRMPLQASDFQGKVPTSATTSALKAIDGIQKSPTSPIDDTVLADEGFTPPDDLNDFYG
jgi:hypothetical protein